MPAVAAVKACLLDMVPDGLQTSGVPTINPTTTNNRIAEVLQRHRTALPHRINNIREILSRVMRDITDNKAVSSFNLQRTPMVVSAVASQSTMRHRAPQQTREVMVVMDL